MGISIFAFILVLGVLVFFHEFGHFIIARLCGVGVEIFSLGFGPRVWGKKMGRTDYRISAIPLGGFVKMVGEDPEAEVAPEDLPVSFTHKPVLQRIMIVAAGPVFNFLLAALIFFAIFRFYGTYVLRPVVGSVNADTPAQTAGLQEGDLVAAINGKEIESWQEMAEIISGSGGDPLLFTIQRDGSSFETEIAPTTAVMPNMFGEETERYVIGITSDQEAFYFRKMAPLDAIGESIYRTYDVARLTLLTIVKLFQGTVSTETLGGPIMIAQMAGEQAKEGAANLSVFIALLSVNLAVLNLLPIPVLDGGHLLFFMIELVMQRPVSTRVREVAQQAGIFVLLLLMMFVFYNDISRILSAS